VGSLLTGPKRLMERAWRIRRRLGGGMRQSGFLAAAGVYALDHHRERLAADHALARMFAEGARGISGVEVEDPQTNIVMLDFPDPEISLDRVLADLAASGVLLVRFGPSRLRAVTHLDVDEMGVERALESLTAAMKEVG
jgi:threonine aldolase